MFILIYNDIMTKRDILHKVVATGIIILLSATSIALAKTHTIKNTTAQKTQMLDDTTLEIIVEDNCAIIKNIGNADAINVKWELQLKCQPLLLISPGKQSGTFDKIEAGSEKIVCYNITGLIFGIGVLKLKATACADNARKARATGVIGFLLGYLLLVTFP